MWLLEELQIPYDLKIFKRNKSMQAGPELKKVHPLGKSPVISIEGAGNLNPLILAESGAIIEYLIEHFGPSLIPKRYVGDREGQVGGETEAWLRDRYFMHYTEGSLMALMLMQLMVRGRCLSLPQIFFFFFFFFFFWFFFLTSDIGRTARKAFERLPCHSLSDL